MVKSCREPSENSRGDGRSGRPAHLCRACQTKARVKGARILQSDEPPQPLGTSHSKGEESAFLSHKKTQTSRKSAGGRGEPSRSPKGPNGMVAWPEHACGPGPTAETAFQVLSSRVLGLAKPRPPNPLCHLRAGWLFFLACLGEPHCHLHISVF